MKQIRAFPYAGVGVFHFADVQYTFTQDYRPSPLNTMILSMDAGTAVQIFLTKHLYIEQGMNLMFGFDTHTTIDLFHPSFMIGWSP